MDLDRLVARRTSTCRSRCSSPSPRAPGTCSPRRRARRRTRSPARAPPRCACHVGELVADDLVAHERLAERVPLARVSSTRGTRARRCDACPARKSRSVAKFCSMRRRAGAQAAAAMCRLFSQPGWCSCPPARLPLQAPLRWQAGCPWRCRATEERPPCPAARRAWCSALARQPESTRSGRRRKTGRSRRCAPRAGDGAVAAAPALASAAPASAAQHPAAPSAASRSAPGRQRRTRTPPRGLSPTSTSHAPATTISNATSGARDVAAVAAGHLGRAEAEQPCRRRLSVERARKLAGLVPGVRVGRDCLREAADFACISACCASSNR